MSISIQNLTKLYHTQKAVNDISFEVKKGEIVGFLGPNGAGKSTTMKIMSCYLPPSSGKVIIAGFDVETNPIDVQKQVGYLPEHNPLYLDLYVEEYLQLAGALSGLKKNKLKIRVEEMMSVCGIAIERKKKIGSLSKGYRQRVGLAQALLHDPSVLILDEPTSGLDPNQIVEIRKLIQSIRSEKTIIFSTHIMQEVEAICDRVVIINKGKIISEGNIEEIKKHAGLVITVQVEFSSAIDIELLKNLKNIQQIESIGNFKYKIQSTDQEIRSAIFKLAAEKNWPLVELKQEDSLESIFHQLTNHPIQ